MGKVFKEEIGVLVNEKPLGVEFHVCESGFEECKPTKPYEFIMIDYWVLHFCVSGEGYFQIRDHQVHVKEGDLFIIPPHTRNKYFPSASNPWSYRWVGMRGTLIEALLKRCGLTPDHFVLHHKTDSHLESLFEKVYDSMNNDYQLKSTGEALQLLDYIEHNVYQSQNDHLTPGEVNYYAASQFIHKNYFNNISISDIAAAANIDRTYMFKLFQKYMGMSPSQYLQQYRLDKACVLLRKTSLSVTDISYAVGFQHAPYFTKLFTRYKEVTPSEYRKGFLQQDDDF